MKIAALVLMMTLPLTGLAQQNARPVIIPPVQTFQPDPRTGQLNYSYSDVTQLIDKATQQWFAQRKSDLDFLETSVKNLVAAYNDLNSDLVQTQIVKASQDSQVNPKGVAVEDYLNLSRSYNSRRQAYLAKLAGIKAIPAGGLPSANGLLVTENKTIDLPAMRSVNVDGLVKTFTDRLTEVDDYVNTLPFKVADVNGVLYPTLGFKLDLSKIVILTPQKRVELEAEIAELRTVPQKLKDMQDQLTGLVYLDAKTYIKKFGEDERYRWRSGDDLTAAKVAYERIYKAFWVRSWLRLKYGIGIGSFRMHYTKRWFGIEELLKKPADYVDLGSVNSATKAYFPSVRSENDLMDIAENIRKNSQAVDHKAVIDGNYNPISIASYLWTFVTGRKAMMESANMILKMIEADVKEEQLVNDGNGQALMKEYYVGRYYLDPTAKTNTRSLECAYDPDFITAVVQANAKDDAEKNFACDNSGVGAEAGAGNTKTLFVKISSAEQGIQENFEVAATKQAQILAQSGADKAQKKLIKGLRGL